MNKRGISMVVTVVLLVLVILVIAGIIFVSSRGFMERIQKQSAETLANMECPENYKFQLQGCFNPGNDNEIKLDIINLKNEIPAGSLISIDIGSEQSLIPIAYDVEVLEGQGASISVFTKIDLSSAEQVNIKIVPVFDYKEVRVLCENLQGTTIQQC